MKFVCRSFAAATFYANGREVVHIQARACAYVAEQLGGLVPITSGYYTGRYEGWWGHSRSQVAKFYLLKYHLGYQYVLTKLEASCHEALQLLTCVLCGRRKSHGQFGFCDKQFDQTLYHRRCLDCLPPSEFGCQTSPSKVKVNGITVKRCGPCRRIYPIAKRASRTVAEIPEHCCGQDLGLLG